MFLRCIVVGSEDKAYRHIYRPVLSSMFVLISGALLLLMAGGGMSVDAGYTIFFLIFSICVCGKAISGRREAAVVESWPEI